MNNRVFQTWSSRRAFLLATIGAAVGLGNIWRFPFVAGQNGGGAFVLIYLGFVLAVGIPIAMAELLLGRRGHASPVNTLRAVTRAENRSSGWMVIGWMSIVMPLFALSFYSVVASWSLEYVARAVLGLFADLDAERSGAVFGNLMASPLRMIFWHSIFIGMTTFVVARGVRGGLEVVGKLLMPALFVILLVMVAYGALAANFREAVVFLFEPDFSQVGIATVLMALGQAFFSLSVGGGYLITYGAYLPGNISIPRACVTICLADSGVALLAGLAIFPIVFANGFAADGGPGLMFQSLPVAFGAMPAGHFIGALFFLLLAFAAFTSTVSMLEPTVAWLSEQRGWQRRHMAPVAGLTAWSLGVIVALSFNVWREVKPLSFVPLLRDKGIFDLLDFLIANLALPINAFLMAIFVAWMMSRNAVMQELDLQNEALFGLWRVATRFVAPVAILIVLVSTLRDNLGL